MVGLKIDSKKKKTPKWLHILLHLQRQEKFFGTCVDHQDQNKEIDMFCIDCSTCGCQRCLILSHSGHNWLQIRRLDVDNDAINRKDMKKHYDCGEIQRYRHNGAKVVFLNPCKQTTETRSNNLSSCEACGRSLTKERYSYCSIGCKVEDEEDQRPQSVRFSLGSSSQETAEETQTTPEPKSTEVESSSLVGSSSMTEDDRPQSEPISFRRRRRKQSNPLRAPFF